MGDISDYYTQHSLSYEYHEQMLLKDLLKRCDDLEKKYTLGILEWKTEKKGEILVIKMTKSHLTNTVAFLQRKKSTEIVKKWIELLSYELQKR